jgi:hypothetical protein
VVQPPLVVAAVGVPVVVEVVAAVVVEALLAVPLVAHAPTLSLRLLN